MEILRDISRRDLRSLAEAVRPTSGSPAFQPAEAIRRKSYLIPGPKPNRFGASAFAHLEFLNFEFRLKTETRDPKPAFIP